jgi:7-cyano-7-deazaguanine synthase
MRVGVLSSGGVDSTVLLADLVASGDRPVPLHVRSGLRWEDAEARTLARLLDLTPLAGATEPLVTLTADARDVYPADHWGFTGPPPAWGSGNVEVLLHGRNLLTLSKAATWCAGHGITRLCLAPLLGNPFPDATPDFFAALSRAASLGLGQPVSIEAPYLSSTKVEVIERGRELGVPLVDTLSCLNPTSDDGHCVQCSKCRERFDAFAICGLPTPDW